MEKPVWEWLELYRYIVHRQSPMPGGRTPDLLGYSVDFDNFAVIELKMYKFTEALFQAKLYRQFCHFSYIAFPEDRAMSVSVKHQETLIEAGIGLLAVAPESVRIVMPAAINLKAEWKDLYIRFVKDIRRKIKRK